MTLPRPALAVAALSVLGTAPGCFCGASCFDYFSDVATEALFLGLEDPVENVDIGEAATATAFLAQATSLSDIEANLLDDADGVWISAPGIGQHALPFVDSGTYTLSSADAPALAYQAGSTYTVTVQDQGEQYDVSAVAPPPPDFTGPAEGTHPAGAALEIDLTGQGYANALFVVVNEDGDLTADSRPQSVGDYLDWIGGGEVSVVTIPGSAFPSAGAAYVVAVAGLVRAEDAAFDGFNPLVSNFALGSLAATPVVTAP